MIRPVRVRLGEEHEDRFVRLIFNIRVQLLDSKKSFRTAVSISEFNSLTQRNHFGLRFQYQSSTLGLEGIISDCSFNIRVQLLDSKKSFRTAVSISEFNSWTQRNHFGLRFQYQSSTLGLKGIISDCRFNIRVQLLDSKESFRTAVSISEFNSWTQMNHFGLRFQYQSSILGLKEIISDCSFNIRVQLLDSKESFWTAVSISEFNSWTQRNHFGLRCYYCVSLSISDKHGMYISMRFINCRTITSSKIA